MSRHIDYGKLMHHAMRGLIRQVLGDVRDNGLPGAHHFFITFDTTHPQVAIADWLRARYPGEMTIVIQNWFADLDVSADGFSITLNFGDTPEPLTIPYDAIRTFVDPSVEFGLRFESHDAEDGDDPDQPGDSDDPDPGPDGSPDGTPDATIVRLDSFRK